MASKNDLSDKMKEALDNNGYKMSGGYYQKQRPDGKTIIAIKNGNGVILHLGDEDGNILTRIEQPAIHTSKQVDNPEDLPSAESGWEVHL